MSDDTDVSTSGPPHTLAAPPPLTRADTADYLDRANWDPDKARAMAAQERLSNLGAHPDVVAQAVAPQMPQVASAAPAPSIPPARVAPQPGRVVSITPQPQAPKPQRKATAAPIDLSAGFVPKTAAPTASDGDIDLSSGFVPKETAPAEKPGALKGLYDTTVGPVVDLAKREYEHLNTVGPDTPVSAITEDPVVQAGKNIVKSHVATAGKAVDAAGAAIKGYGSAVKSAVGGDLNQAGVEAQNAGEEATKGMGYGLASVVPGVGPAAAKVGEDFADNPKYAAGETAGLLASSVVGAKGAKGAGEIGEEVLPSTETIADTDLPLTVGQGMTKANPAGAGPFVQGAEGMAKGLPLSKGLRKISSGQQAGAREILAGKAEKMGADVSTAPEAIEKNFLNAAEKVRQQGHAKYEAIADAAKDADLAPTTQAAVDILGDPETTKILPVAARNALAKVGAAASERDAIARQIYGRAASTLDPDELANVIKAEKTAPEANFPSISGGAMRGVLDARSKLSSAASGMHDPAAKFRVNQALDKFDTAVNESLKAHDEMNGTTLTQDLHDANQLWTQKYATETWVKHLQGVMRGTPSQGIREINGAAFQKLVNKLDPPGGLIRGKSTLQRMFPNDPKSVADIHDLADFMGKNQARAGGFGSMMARMRVVGLNKTAIPFMANAAGFSALMSKPGFAGALLKAFRAGGDAAKLSVATADINHLVGDGELENNRANSGDSAAIQPGTVSADGLPSTDATSLPSNKNGNIKSADTNAATATNALTTPATTKPIAPITSGTITNKQIKNSVTPAANSKPNSMAGDVTTEPAPAQVPESVTNGKRSEEPKFKHGSTQANIPKESAAANALEGARLRINPKDLAGKGTNVGGNHLTVRYGIKGENTDGIKKYLGSLAPFEASLGKTEKFPPSEHSDGAAVIHAPIEAPELHTINKEIEKHGEFSEPSFGEYKPHATVAYVKPEAADRYTGMSATNGKKFTVNSIAITDRDGNQTEVKLGGSQQGKGFDHPSRQADKEAGWRAALKSKSTPSHLKPHLEKNLSQ